MPNHRTGQTLVCQFCGNQFYRRGSHIKRGIIKSCGNSECKSAAMSGANNPFWGKKHDQTTIDRINATKRSRPPQRKGGPPKGYQHTPQARKLMSDALKERWRTNRDKMIAALPRGEDHHFRKTNHQPRHRQNFTEVQRRDWIEAKCFYCEATEDLVLDHIIPVMAGGQRLRCNAQTLCRSCNLWKMWFVDRPFYLATLGSQGG